MPSDLILFAVFPYVAFSLAVAVGAYRYFYDRSSYSSFSTQFLENRWLFWGSVPWHYGLLIVLLAHLLGALFPGTWATLFGKPPQLYILEVAGLGLGFFTLAGIGLLLMRRLTNPRVRRVTSVMDWILLVGLLLQVASGVDIALVHRWGSVWYLSTAVPWLRSLVLLNPKVDLIAQLPWTAKFHIFNAFVLFSLFPFTQLVHIFTIPITSLWRPYQVVIWNRKASPTKSERPHLQQGKA